jgi:rhodanese-related sulfurtransferase
MARLALLTLLLAPLLGAAQEPPAAEVDAAHLREWLATGRKLTLVDSRSEAEYEAGHIPGAISIPEEEMKDDAWRLPADKTAPVVFYCRGPG